MPRCERRFDESRSYDPASERRCYLRQVRSHEGIGGFLLRQMELFAPGVDASGQFHPGVDAHGRIIQALRHMGDFIHELMHVDEFTFQALMHVVEFMLMKKRCRDKAPR